MSNSAHDDERRPESESSQPGLAVSHSDNTEHSALKPDSDPFSSHERDDSARKRNPASAAMTAASTSHTKILEDCLFGSDKVSLTELRKLASAGIHDLVAQEQRNEYSWRGLSWRIMLGYLPNNTHLATNDASAGADDQRPASAPAWKDALNRKRQIYFDHVHKLFQSDYDTLHGEELLPTCSAPSTSISLSSREARRSVAFGDDQVHNYPVPQSANQMWKDSGRDTNVLQGLTRGMNALHIIDSDATETDGDGARTKPIQSALLLDEIRKDVVRTHPDLSFFQDPLVGRRRYAALERILLCSCWQSARYDYVQGMNEIVATLYYALATTTTTKPRRKSTEGSSSSTMEECGLAQEDWAAHAEVDTFWLFSILMEELHAIYNRDLDEAESGIRGRLSALEDLLTKHDPEVMDHLVENGLDSSFFAVRWWTTLLSREFLLPDTMRLWDSMFASTHKDNFLRYVCVTMVMTIRDGLLTGDLSSCLRLLQSYPSTHMDQLLQSTRALWIYESQITVACHKGGISLHHALETIAPPPAIIMAFGLKAGSAQHGQQSALDFADVAAERVRDVAAQANVWLGKARYSIAVWKKSRNKPTGELGQEVSMTSTTKRSQSNRSSSAGQVKEDVASGKAAATATAAEVSAPTSPPSLFSAFDDSLYLQAIESSAGASLVDEATDAIS
jgi:hypothetical protein